jgi:hypothetical protein
MSTQLTPYSRKIVNLATALGGISKEQLKVLFKETEYHDDDSYTKLNKTLAFLRKNRYVTYKDDIVTPFPDDGSFKPEKLDSVWVAINKCKTSDGAYNIEDLINSFPNEPVSIVMINSEDNNIYNIVSLNERSLNSVMSFVVEKFKSEHRDVKPEKLKNIQYIFAVNDKALIPEIASYNPPMQNKIALLVEGENGAKNVKYLSKKA